MEQTNECRIAVITGATIGVGRATAVAFARAGFDAALLARGGAGLAAAASNVEAAGATAFIVPVDVADAAAVELAARRVETELGEIDVWVNNVMTTVFAPAWTRISMGPPRRSVRPWKWAAQTRTVPGSLTMTVTAPLWRALALS